MSYVACLVECYLRFITWGKRALFCAKPIFYLGNPQAYGSLQSHLTRTPGTKHAVKTKSTRGITSCQFSRAGIICFAFSGKLLP